MLDHDNFRNFLIGGLVLITVAVAYKYHSRTTFAADGLTPYWDGTVEQARITHRPSLVLFTADWCPSCRALHSEVLCRPDISQEINVHYVMMTVDLTSPGYADIARQKRYGIRGIPTLIRFDADGKETARTHYVPPDQMMAWLQAGE